MSRIIMFNSSLSDILESPVILDTIYTDVHGLQFVYYLDESCQYLYYSHLSISSLFITPRSMSTTVARYQTSGLMKQIVIQRIPD